MFKRTCLVFLVSAVSTAITATMTIAHSQPTESVTDITQTALFCKYSSGLNGVFIAGSPDTARHSLIDGKAGLIEDDGTVVVRLKDQSSQIVYIDENTKITRNGKPSKLSDLRPGDEVQAVVGGNRKAIEFTATGP